MQQLFEDADLRELDVRLSHHELPEQAQLVAQGKLDLAAFVMQEGALAAVISCAPKAASTSVTCRRRRQSD